MCAMDTHLKCFLVSYHPIHVSIANSTTHRNLNDWTIQLGITRRHSHTYYGQKVKVSRVIPHPHYSYSASHDNDIAMIQVSCLQTYLLAWEINPLANVTSSLPLLLDFTFPSSAGNTSGISRAPVAGVFTASQEGDPPGNRVYGDWLGEARRQERWVNGITRCVSEWLPVSRSLVASGYGGKVDKGCRKISRRDAWWQY